MKIIRQNKAVRKSQNQNEKLPNFCQVRIFSNLDRFLIQNGVPRSLDVVGWIVFHDGWSRQNWQLSSSRICRLYASSYCQKSHDWPDFCYSRIVFFILEIIPAGATHYPQCPTHYLFHWMHQRSLDLDSVAGYFNTFN